MAVAGAHNIELLFKKAAGLKADKSKVKQISDVIDEKLYDLLLVGEMNAKYNDRDVIWYSDIPLTKAFRESMNKFRELEEELELKPILDHLASLPPLKYGLEIELENRLPEIAGTIIYILASIIKEFSPKDRTISAEEFEKGVEILNLMI
jgi:hypothetical protein